MVGKISTSKGSIRGTGDGEMRLKNQKNQSPRWFLNQTTKTERDDQSKAVTLSRLTRRRGLLVGRSRLVGGRLNNTRSKKALLLRGSYIVKLARGETLVRGRPDFFCPLVSTPSSHGRVLARHFNKTTNIRSVVASVSYHQNGSSNRSSSCFPRQSSSCWW